MKESVVDVPVAATLATKHSDFTSFALSSQLLLSRGLSKTDSELDTPVCHYRDDCGVWQSGKGTTPKTCYCVLPSGDF